MADEKLFYYRGFPLIRSGNTIFYGCGGDEYATILTIKGTKTVQDTEIPDKVLVQLVPTRGGAGEKFGRHHLRHGRPPSQQAEPHE